MTTATMSWDEVLDEFKHVVFSRGVQKVAEAIPASRKTVYRLLHGEPKRPSRAIRAGVERLVKKEQQHKD